MMPAVSALQADTVAVAGALPMCNAPVESTTTRHRRGVREERPYGPGADGAVGRERAGGERRMLRRQEDNHTI